MALLTVNETFEGGVSVYSEVVNTTTDEMTIYEMGVATETRPLTPEEIQHYGALEAQTTHNANTMEIVAESDPAVEKLIAVVEALNTITSMTNASINSNVAPILKDVVRELKTVARQLNHEVRLTAGRTESTDTGTVVP